MVEGEVLILNRLVIGECKSGPNCEQVEHEVVVDSGELFVVDATIAEDDNEKHSVNAQLKKLRANAKRNQSFAGILLDQSGLARGVVVAPPNGDGAYFVQSRCLSGEFELLCDFAPNR